MNQEFTKKMDKKNSNGFFQLKGWWQFDQNYEDSSGANNTLNALENLPLISPPGLPGAVQLNGKSQCLETQKLVLDTTKSYTVSAWVRLDSSPMDNKLILKSGENALTSLSQNSSTHSAFYLGLRQIDKEQSDGVLTSSLRWNFTVSPVDGSETGPVEWQHAYAETSLDNSVLNKWFLLVGVCDSENRTSSIYIPNANDRGTIMWPQDFIQVDAREGLQVGRALWLGKNVDYWPGSIGPIKVFSGAMTEQEITNLYNKGEL